jgi:hypothetical protein
MQAALSWLGVPSTRRLAGLVTHNLTATNRILMPNQIDITIRKEFVKEFAMTPPPALLSGTMQGAAVSSAFGGAGRPSSLPKFSSSTNQANRVGHEAACPIA